MATPPFVIDETSPASTDLVSQFPANEQTNRDVIESWLTFISEPTTGMIKLAALPTGIAFLANANTFTADQTLEAGTNGTTDYPLIIENSAGTQRAEFGAYGMDVTAGTGTYTMGMQLRVEHSGENIQLVSPNATQGPAYMRFRTGDDTAIGFVGMGSGSTDVLSLTRNTAGILRIDPSGSGTVEILGTNTDFAGSITGVTSFTASGAVVGGAFTGASFSAAVFANGVGFNFRPNGAGSTTNQATLSTGGNLTLAGSCTATAFNGNATSATTATTATNCSRSVTGGTGLTGGGVLTSNQVISVDSTVWRDANTPSANQLAEALSGFSAVILNSAGTISGNSAYLDLASTGGTAGINIRQTSSTGKFCRFYSPSNLEIGSIQNNGDVATTYNTSSDYRRKTQVKKIVDSGIRLDAINPVAFTWDTGHNDLGFLAHEFAEVYPQAVHGKKDAVDDIGQPVYQSMQASHAAVMADLVAEVQALRKRVATLETV